MAAQKANLSAEDYQEAEREVLRQAQQDSSAEEFSHLSAGKPVPTTSRLLPLAPEYDDDVIHPVILDSWPKVTQLIAVYKDLHHPGAICCATDIGF